MNLAAIINASLRLGRMAPVPHDEMPRAQAIFALTGGEVPHIVRCAVMVNVTLYHVVNSPGLSPMWLYVCRDNWVAGSGTTQQAVENLLRFATSDHLVS